jgi:hypothetical protein
MMAAQGLDPNCQRSGFMSRESRIGSFVSPARNFSHSVSVADQSIRPPVHQQQEVPRSPQVSGTPQPFQSFTLPQPEFTMTFNSPIDPATPGQDRDSLYRMSEALMIALANTGLTLQGSRVLHGLVHHVCRQTSDWHNGGAVQDPNGYLIRLVDLRRNLGLERANGNAAVKAGLQNLVNLKFLVNCRLKNANQWLEFKLAADAFDCLFDEMPYGLFDIRHVRHLSTPLDFLIYEKVGLLRRRRAPEFSLFLNADRNPDPSALTWPRLRPKLTSSLQKSAMIFDLQFMAICRAGGTRIGIDHLTIRIRSAKTRWSAKSFASVPTSVRKVLLIDRNKCLESSP